MVVLACQRFSIRQCIGVDRALRSKAVDLNSQQ